MNKVYYVYNPNTKFTRYQHANYESAKAEAARMARAHPGCEFQVLLAVCSAKKADVIIDEISPMDQIPF